MASELASMKVVETIETPKLPSLPQGVSFQDLDSDSEQDDDNDDTINQQDEEEILQAAEAAFTQEEADYLINQLKERGLWWFMKTYVQSPEHSMPIPTLLLAFGVLIPPETSFENQLRILKVTCSRVLRAREKLQQYNTIQDAVNLISSSKKIMVLTGAGVSTSCGIPDFRSPTGLYARLKEEHWELDDPQQMFDLPYFREKPNVFYSFAKEIYPSNFTPSPCHRFVKALENNGKLLRNYTQNIDGLFEQMGVERMLNCHGSFATASCLRCRTRFPGSAIEADVFASRVPLCPLCTALDAEQEKKHRPPTPAKIPDKWSSKGKAFEDDDQEDLFPPKSEWEGKPLVKPDIVFFGEMLSDEFDHRLLEDREEVDLLIVIGTSLRVSPVAQIVSHLPHSVPQILINRDSISHATFDIVLLGDGDTIVKYLCSLLNALSTSDGLQDPHSSSSTVTRAPSPAPLAATTTTTLTLSTATPPRWSLPPPPNRTGPAPPLTSFGEHVQEEQSVQDIVPERVATSHVWLFPGSNPDDRWVQLVRRAYEEEDTEDEDEEGEQAKADAEAERGERERQQLVAEISSSGDHRAGRAAVESGVTIDEAGTEGLRVPLLNAVELGSKSRSRSPPDDNPEDVADHQNPGKRAKME